MVPVDELSNSQSPTSETTRKSCSFPRIMILEIAETLKFDVKNLIAGAATIAFFYADRFSRAEIDVFSAITPFCVKICNTAHSPLLN